MSATATRPLPTADEVRDARQTLCDAFDRVEGVVSELEANAWHESADTSDELLGAVHRLAQTLRHHGVEFVDVSERLLANVNPAA